VAATKEALYPVGSIYTNAAVTTSPATLLGFGTWEEFGSGRVMVGQNTGDGSFDTLQETGGSKDAIVVSHSHSATVSDPGHAHVINGDVPQGDTERTPSASTTNNLRPTSRQTNGATTGISVGISTAGSSATNANLQPYIVVKMWRRTA
jgi:microcystin-dependent protein